MSVFWFLMLVLVIFFVFRWAKNYKPVYKSEDSNGVGELSSSIEVKFYKDGEEFDDRSKYVVTQQDFIESYPSFVTGLNSNQLRGPCIFVNSGYLRKMVYDGWLEYVPDNFLDPVKQLNRMTVEDIKWLIDSNYYGKVKKSQRKAELIADLAEIIQDKHIPRDARVSEKGIKAIEDYRHKEGIKF